MLSDLFLIIVTILYAGSLVAAIVESHWPVALMLSGYIIANIGLIFLNRSI